MSRVLSVFNMVITAITANSYKTVCVHKNCTRVVGNRCFVYKVFRYSTGNNNIATYEEVKEIGVSKTKKVLLIDVREPKELKETGVIPGSINIPLGRIAHALKDMPDEEFLRMYGIKKPNVDSPIIFSCRSGRRSADAQAVSRQLGYKNVKSYSGGWIDWEKKSKINKSS